MASGWKVVCAMCAGGSDTLKRCTGCFQVYYCSTACQRSHWPVHRRDCKENNGKEKAPSPGKNQGTPPAARVDSNEAPLKSSSKSDDTSSVFDPEQSETTRPRCDACEKMSPAAELKRCGACKKVRYCSTSCQRNHWKQHQPHCDKVEETIKTDGVKKMEREAFLRRQGSKAAGVPDVNLTLFDLMIGRWTEFPECPRTEGSFDRAMIVARRSFPKMEIVDNFQDVPPEYEFFPTPRRDYVILAFIYRQHYHSQRHGVYIKDKSDHVTHVLFYLEGDSPYPYFTWSDVRPGRYLCVRNARLHNFLDGTLGLRVDQPDTISFIDA